jgi:hypothetical protein
MRCALALALIGALLAASSAVAQSTDAAAAGEDFVSLCTVVALAPGAVETVAAGRGLARVISADVGPTYKMSLYSDQGSERSVQVTHQQYADATETQCRVIGLFTSSEADIQGVVAKLEGHPKLGKLDGELLTLPAEMRLATYKKKGNAPLLFIQISAPKGNTIFSMAHWNLKPGQ